MENVLGIVANIVTIIGLSIAVGSIYYLYKQIEQTRNIEEAKTWLDLRNMFYNNHKNLTFMIIEKHLKVVKHLNENKDGDIYILKYEDNLDKKITDLIPEDYLENELDLYLGQFEMTYNLVKKEFLDKDIFMTQYKYRIDFLFENTKYIEFLNYKLDKEKIYWKNLILLIEECKNYKM